jgi:hypothetical protein
LKSILSLLLELVHSYGHVCLLWSIGSWTFGSKVPMVETLSHSNATGNWILTYFLDDIFIVNLKVDLNNNKIKIQFVIVMVHSITNIVSECSYPKGYSISFVVYGVFITMLFLNFYLKSYSKVEKAASSDDTKLKKKK